jgi:hypothetical protein
MLMLMTKKVMGTASFLWRKSEGECEVGFALLGNLPEKKNKCKQSNWKVALFILGR